MSHEVNIQGAFPAKRSLPRIVGLSMLASLIVFAILVPLIWGVDPVEQDRSTLLSGPMHAHPLGTDERGRDMLARLAAAVRLSLGFALFSVITAAVPGILLGILAAWKGGATDKCLVLLAEVFLVLPGLLLVLLIAVIFPGNILALYGAVVLVLWTEYFHKTRALCQTALASPAVAATRQQGLGPLYVIRRHLWPELSSVVITVSALGAASAITTLATLSYTLSYIGAGLSITTVEFGFMIRQFIDYYAAAPFSFALPIFVIFLMVLSLILIGGARKR
ncbi:peptide/nickel transport system permease protein [Pseudomonas viridiflava]|uniref:ABC transporter permease n=1 Tax=Pseudomonas syringae TaxID=317 RepID=UPI000BB66E70|nr:ABC transporter permease [Pseudomonas syringae]PBP84110.1 ABC transporter permease [Pseudomonas syringae]